MLISKYLRILSNEELALLTEVVSHEALSEEVTRRFKQRYEEVAYAFYNSEDYAIIGNITELGVEDHGTLLYQELASELVSHIRTLL